MRTSSWIAGAYYARVVRNQLNQINVKYVRTDDHTIQIDYQYSS